MKYDIESINKRKKMNKTIKKVIYVFLIIIIYNVILLSISLINNTQMPAIFGNKLFVITSESMQPQINKGDIIISREVEENQIKVNDIITFKENDEFITHRITKIEKNGNKSIYTTKGDSNNVEDSKKVTYEQIQGVEIIIIPWIGNLIFAAQNSILIILILLVVSIIYLVKLNIDEKKENRREKKKIADEKYSEKKEE